MFVPMYTLWNKIYLNQKEILKTVGNMRTLSIIEKPLITKNMPIQIYWEFYHQKTKTFRWKTLDIFFYIFAQNIDCGYSLEPPQQGSSNAYPQSMFLSRRKKINVYPCKPQFYCIKVEFKGVKTI